MSTPAEILAEGPVWVEIIDADTGDPIALQLAQWAYQTERGLVWVPAEDGIGGPQRVHFVPGEIEQTGEREITLTPASGSAVGPAVVTPPIGTIEPITSQTEALREEMSRNDEMGREPVWERARLFLEGIDIGERVA